MEKLPGKLFVACLSILFLLVSTRSIAQSLPEPITSEGIYDFLDELATLRIININSAIKPYDRAQISIWLKQGDQFRSKLSERQQRDLDFYLLEFNPDKWSERKKWLGSYTGQMAVNPSSIAVGYKDSLLRFEFRPILSYGFQSNGDNNLKRSYWGASFYATIGKNWSAWASLRDNHESELILSPGYLINRQGLPLKNSPNGGYDFSEMNGGVMYSWSWGSFGLIKDRLSWGNNYNGSNILSGNTPSFAHISLKLKPARWIELNYIHGWLVSNVVDSTRSFWDDYVYRVVLRPKYIAANLITITPLKGLNLSFGNSVIYSDQNVHPAYLIPVFFYKSVDHTLNNTNLAGESGQNAQLFFDFSSRQISHLHLFLTGYFDEIHISRIKEGKIHNFFSLKPGFRVDGWPFVNLSFQGEYTLTKPLAYQHKISTTTFTTNDYNLGHYLRDNSKELYLSTQYKPLRGVRVVAWYTDAKHYNNYIYNDRLDIDGDKPFADLTWSRTEIGFKVGWEFAYNSYLLGQVSFSESKGYEADGYSAEENLNRFTPEFYRGKRTFVGASLSIGF